MSFFLFNLRLLKPKFQYIEIEGKLGWIFLFKYKDDKLAQSYPYTYFL